MPTSGSSLKFGPGFLILSSIAGYGIPYENFFCSDCFTIKKGECHMETSAQH